MLDGHGGPAQSARRPNLGREHEDLGVAFPECDQGRREGGRVVFLQEVANVLHDLQLELALPESWSAATDALHNSHLANHEFTVEPLLSRENEEPRTPRREEEVTQSIVPF